MSDIDDYFARKMPDAMKWFEDQATEPTPGGFLIPPAMTGQLAGVVKASGYIEVPDELLMAYGLIPDTRPPLPPLPWRWRLRNKASDWREQAARRAFRVIAGYWPDDGEDW